MAVPRGEVGIAAVVDGQAQDQVERRQVVGIEVYLVECVGKGMAERAESGLGGKIYHADESLVGDLGRSTFYNIPKREYYVT